MHVWCLRWCRCLFGTANWLELPFQRICKSSKIYHIYRNFHYHRVELIELDLELPFTSFLTYQKLALLHDGWFVGSSNPTGGKFCPDLSPALHTDMVLVCGAIHACNWSFAAAYAYDKTVTLSTCSHPINVKGASQTQKKACIERIQESSIASSELKNALSALLGRGVGVNNKKGAACVLKRFAGGAAYDLSSTDTSGELLCYRLRRSAFILSASLLWYLYCA